MIAFRSAHHVFMRRQWIPLFALTLWAAGALPAQDNPDLTAPFPRGGFQIRSVSVYGVYYSHSLPIGSIQPGAARLPSDVGLGGNTVFDWSRFNDRSTFLLTYTPSYTARARYSSLNALNHTLLLNARRKFHRWAFDFSLAGDYSTLEQSLFAPTALGNATSVPASFDDLAAGLLSNRFPNNPQLGFAITGAPLLESPVSTLLYGTRVFNSSGHAALSYSYSPRLSVTFTGGTARAQHLSDDLYRGGAIAPIIPNTTSVIASAAISYSLTPLTQIGGNVTTGRTSSSILDSYVTTAQATLGRTFARRWILNLNGGVGVTKPLRQQTSLVVTSRPQPTGGGSLAYKTYSSTFLGSVSRTVSDAYGLGATATSTASASWRWRQPGRDWWIENSFSWQQLQGNTAVNNTSGWHFATGFGRIIGRHLTLLTQYSYLHYSGGLLAANSTLGQSAVRVSMVWTPDRQDVTH